MRMFELCLFTPCPYKPVLLRSGLEGVGVISGRPTGSYARLHLHIHILEVLWETRVAVG